MLRELLKGIKAFVIGGELPTPDESRIAPRLLCQYRVNLLYGDTEFKASVVDIGSTGMRLEGVPEMNKGDHLRISYPFAEHFQEDVGFEVEVMWTRVRTHDGVRLTGVRYIKQGEELKGTWVRTLQEEVGLHGDSTFQKRKHVRLATTLKAEVRDLDSGRFLSQGKVNNLSVGGALIESPEELKKNNRVMALIGPHLNYPTLSVHARVLNSRADEDDGVYLHSLQFVDVNKKQLKTLERLVLKMLQGRSLG
ncbi:MAG: PilZ domain-containing protein [Vulcanimicrobiota bacterium]